MRQWCYVGSKLDQEVYERSSDQFGPGGKMLQLLKPLLANHRELIGWFAHYDRAYDMERVDNRKTHDFWAYQAAIALRGDWDRLVRRCEAVINDPPKAASEQKYLIDHHFYLALAHRDLGRMQEVLQELATPQALRARAKDESGFTEDLISTPAVIYAKIAWLHGCEIRVDTPYIPADWLPMDPLPRYDNHYRFLK